ncbi:hypothetical protein ACFYOV_18015 [Streptomyces sp. NPDC005931]|uniref:hypothetical protein n=1 Tax=Streptomyces sp. NPDC005931 TaxID=3364737 RepID=UPI0036B71741
MTTASTSATSVPLPVHQRVAALAATHIGTWQEGYLKDRSPAVAALARLRRGAGWEAGETHARRRGAAPGFPPL